MKKIIAGLVALAALSNVAFAEIKLSFYNKLYEDDYFWSKSGDESDTDFPQIKERMFAEVKSEKVDAMIKATFALDDYDGKHFGLQGKVNDWYVEFRPIEILTLALHDNINSEGSYLPIYDDNLQGGNIGSNGFTVVVRPNAFNKALRIALTAPFSFDDDPVSGINYFNGKADDGEDENFHVGAGFIFSIPQIELGATFQNLPCSDHRLIGASVAFPTLFGVNEGLNLRVGFTHAEDKQAGFEDLLDAFGVIGENVLNAAVTFEKDAIHVNAESVYTLKADAEIYDLYGALNFGYDVNDKLGLGVTGKILLDLDSDTKADNVYVASINADYSINENNTVGAEVRCLLTKDGDNDFTAIKVPLYWKYHFDN